MPATPHLPVLHNRHSTTTLYTCMRHSANQTFKHELSTWGCLPAAWISAWHAGTTTAAGILQPGRETTCLLNFACRLPHGGRRRTSCCVAAYLLATAAVLRRQRRVQRHAARLPGSPPRMPTAASRHLCSLLGRDHYRITPVAVGPWNHRTTQMAGLITVWQAAFPTQNTSAMGLTPAVQ